jgi:hypothetical protein
MITGLQDKLEALSITQKPELPILAEEEEVDIVDMGAAWVALV